MSDTNLSDAEPVILTGVVKSKVKGGFLLRVNGKQAFLPERQSYLQHHQLPNIGEVINIYVLKSKPNELIVSRKRLLEKERDLLREKRVKDKERIFGTARIGDIHKGVISALANYGVFVDIGGWNALLHISSISQSRHADLKSFYTEGQELLVQISDIDKERGRMSLVEVEYNSNKDWSCQG